MTSVYVPRALTPLYTLIWRSILSYFTIVFGFLVFSALGPYTTRGARRPRDEPPAAPAPRRSGVSRCSLIPTKTPSSARYDADLMRRMLRYLRP